MADPPAAVTQPVALHSSSSLPDPQIADDPPTPSHVSSLPPVNPSTTPRDVIHSVSPTSQSARLSQPPVIQAVSTPRKKFSIFSPRPANSSSKPNLRRLFSRSRRPGSGLGSFGMQQLDDEGLDAEGNPNATPTSTNSTNATTSRRKRFVRRLRCPCLAGRPALVEQLSELDYAHHLKTLEPTYEPPSPLLPLRGPNAADRICLVLDLDETLVHSSFTPIPGADFEIPLEMQGEVHTVYVKKRPGVDHFLKKASEWYEIVIFTASLALYANPVVDLLDPHNLVQLRLYREHCVLVGGCYVKDIAKLGRDLKRTFIIDNSPLSYVLQPENAIPITAFFTDDNDRELEKTLALLEQARHLKDVRKAFS